MARAALWSDVWRQRLAAHSLDRPAPASRLNDLVGDVCGIHAQVAASAELSLGLRLDAISQADIRSALWTERSLVKTYGLRGTLHVFASHELPMWLAALRAKVPAGPPNPTQSQSLRPERVPEVVEAMRDALDGRQLTRDDLGRELEMRLGAYVTERAHPAFAGYMPRWQQALVPAALSGVLVFGPNRGARVTYVRLDQWLGPLPEVDGRAALQEVTRRYVRAYGPATHTELARWLYTPPAAARSLLDSLGDELAPVDVEGWRALQLATTPAAREAEPGMCEADRTVHLLPRFDCYVVGCHPRQQLVPEYVPAALRRGTAAPYQVLLVDGVVGGLWEQQRRRTCLSLRVDPFRPLSAPQLDELEMRARRLADFYGCRQVELELAQVQPRWHM